MMLAHERYALQVTRSVLDARLRDLTNVRDLLVSNTKRSEQLIADLARAVLPETRALLEEEVRSIHDICHREIARVDGPL